MYMLVCLRQNFPGEKLLLEGMESGVRCCTHQQLKLILNGPFLTQCLQDLVLAR